MEILGIDIGGTGIKGAIVNTETGEMVTDRHRILTPQPATPTAVCETVARLTTHFQWYGPIGCGFPAAVRDGVVLTAANIAPEWIGCDARDLIQQTTGCPTVILNDADAAGYAEVAFGAAQNEPGTVMIFTLGTGIGSAVFVNGQLVPNTELGHVEIGGKEAEKRASGLVREVKGLSWKKWAKRLNLYLSTMHAYFWPDLITLGGGASKKHDKFLHLLDVPCPVVPARMLNTAGIVGAAFAALQVQERELARHKKAA